MQLRFISSQNHTGCLCAFTPYEITGRGVAFVELLHIRPSTSGEDHRKYAHEYHVESMNEAFQLTEHLCECGKTRISSLDINIISRCTYSIHAGTNVVSCLRLSMKQVDVIALSPGHMFETVRRPCTFEFAFWTLRCYQVVTSKRWIQSVLGNAQAMHERSSQGHSWWPVDTVVALNASQTQN